MVRERSRVQSSLTAPFFLFKSRNLRVTKSLIGFGATPECYTTALQMARPYKHPRTGVYYFRQRVPTDLRPLVGDKIVSRSLGTKEPETAKLRNVDEVRKQAVIWAGHRKKPEPLPVQQIVALSGILYRDHMAAIELEPGEPAVWTETPALLSLRQSRHGMDPRWTISRWSAVSSPTLQAAFA